MYVYQLVLFNNLQGYFPKPRPKKPYQPVRKVHAALPTISDFVFPSD